MQRMIAPARLSNAGARLLKRCGFERVRHAVRVTVGDELFRLGATRGVFWESSCGVLCCAERLVRWLKKTLGWIVLVL